MAIFSLHSNLKGNLCCRHFVINAVKYNNSCKMRSFVCSILIVVLLMSFTGLNLIAQTSNSISIKATANVIESAEIELITKQDLMIDMSMAVNGMISIDARHDISAGLIQVRGRPGANFRIKHVPQMKLLNSTGNGAILIQFSLSGFHSELQLASEPLDAVERQLRFSQNGSFFLWLGGYVDIINAPPGNYSGEFNIEIEYI